MHPDAYYLLTCHLNIMKVKIYLSIFYGISVLLISSAQAQIINGYAKVTAILPGGILNVSTQNETAGATATFSPGMEILVMQMQDSTLGNVTNTASFGNVGAIRSAGLFEYAVISSVTRTAGVLNSVTLTSTLIRAFKTGTNASLQIITFPTLGSPNFTTTGNITALPWNGDIGGIINFKVNGNLTLGHLIDARGAGFRGGAVNANNGSSCENATFISAPNNKYAGKGEGIFKNTNVNFNIAKGRIMNGGGGGIVHNGGGGGGGNFSAGGNGGTGYNTGGCTGSAGGLGGAPLNGLISTVRLFMGGGGGAGQQNNGNASAGGRGGGIIFIKADTIKSGVGCGVLIDASGIAALNTTLPNGNDGAGGGGAGGSVYLDALDFKIDVSCPLSIKGDGGNGGNAVTAGAAHAGGGGGGQGVIIFANARPTTNVISTVLNGTGGADNTAGSTTATNGSGVSNTGIFQNQGPLPVELLYFYAEKLKNNSVELIWATASEKNNKRFSIYRSKDLIAWELIHESAGKLISSVKTEYATYDFEPLNGLNYYKLLQEDMDGKQTELSIQVVEFDKDLKNNIIVYPNPSNRSNEIFFEKVSSSTIEKMVIYNALGKEMPKRIDLNGNKFILNISGFTDGIYFIDYKNPRLNSTKLLIQQ
jgi:hypothetical protein